MNDSTELHKVKVMRKGQTNETVVVRKNKIQSRGYISPYE